MFLLMFWEWYEIIRVTPQASRCYYLLDIHRIDFIIQLYFACWMASAAINLVQLCDCSLWALNATHSSTHPELLLTVSLTVYCAAIPKRGNASFQRIHFICGETLQRLSGTDKKGLKLVLGRDNIIQEAAFWTQCHITWHISSACNLLLFMFFFARCLVRVTQEWKDGQDEGMKGWVIFCFCVCFLLMATISV